MTRLPCAVALLLIAASVALTVWLLSLVAGAVL